MCGSRNDYEKDGTISWMISYKKKNLKTSHFQQYSVKVNSDGSYQIIDTTEAQKYKELRLISRFFYHAKIVLNKLINCGKFIKIIFESYLNTN